MDAYIFAADNYCGECIRQLLFDQDLVEADANRADMTPAEAVESAMRAAGYASSREYDSSELPKGPFEDGGGESDVPCNCCKCGKFLENPLTDDGYEYVLAEIKSHPDLSTTQEWREYYGDDQFGPELRTINEILEGS
jgi:hypothetical protein